ncbi:CpaD family pilus assembly protein [Sphingomonas baiyangensis]|uniref:Pilus assembly protein CpaD n=1 Tax=Sphingomonas baiyangensis TaxID=2572576 RepID=A0A4U1L7Z2_9SPHN|nr:CpaD family pilus assembly protein [Sphingomonas baiyangensis]TKD53067.1 pilus assembly protein CpaD [Sphingomonas baiyangensis]
MTKRIPLAAVLLPATLLAGCGGTLNRSVESVHQPVVTRTDYVFDVQASGGGLDASERQRLAGWLASIGTGYGDRLYVDDAGSYDGATRAAIAAEASRYGLLLADGAPVTAGPITPGTVRVILSRSAATVPGCPDYSRMYEPNFGAHTSSNFGCGINSNLAAMVAQPEDLVRGRSGGDVTDAQTASKPIQALRERKTAVDTQLQAPRTSNVGNN